MAVRKAAGLFDVGHMGVVEVTGPGALGFIQRVSTNDASRLAEFRSQYSVLCNERGGTIDDILVYRLGDRFMIVLNASNTDKDLAWFGKNPSPGANVVRTDTRILSLQGPGAERILAAQCDVPLSNMKRNSCAYGKIFGSSALISRTGYTGGDGFELFVPSAAAPSVWSGLLSKGRDRGLLPCGLGARDSLRIEAALPLYGHEYTEDISPIEAGYGWAVKLEKPDFIGRGALEKLKAEGPARRLVGIELVERAIARQGAKVFSDDKMSHEVGAVTSGTFSPLLNRSIALAYARAGTAAVGASVFIDIRGRAFSGIISAIPFYKRT